MSDIQNQDEIARRERGAYTRIMNAMMTLEEPSKMKVLGAVAIMIKPAPAPEPQTIDKRPSTVPQDERSKEAAVSPRRAEQPT